MRCAWGYFQNADQTKASKQQKGGVNNYAGWPAHRRLVLLSFDNFGFTTGRRFRRDFLSALLIKNDIPHPLQIFLGVYAHRWRGLSHGNVNFLAVP
ncbi:Uncharacterised protein [Yersinia nurmii]|uniref:Uncharacterized protein n=1 Tax=Yersinia nurmii TaxID=685706 RepID=A0ABP1Y458_9GAMM|nr:Uncharacterised protein [Yersinia nurmii]